MSLRQEDNTYRLDDLGDRRVLTVEGRRYETNYSERVVRMLIERKGVRRAPPYFDYKRTRGDHFLAPLFRWLRAGRHERLRVLEVGCSFGHITEWLADQPEVAEIRTFDTDAEFVEIVRAKREELALPSLAEIRRLTNEETCALPWSAATFDLVLALGVVEHLPARTRRAQVDEYYRVLTPGGHIAILDTPNRWFPLETHSVGLPVVQWLPPQLAWRYARLGRPAKFNGVAYAEFVADGTGWRNATYRECLPTWRDGGVEDVTEAAGYGWRFFRDTARSRTRRAVLPAFAVAVAGLRACGQAPSLCLPYLNLLFRRTSQ
jgi:2-polyprenyl-3-methyl-5-hydroxy-6-metoxy-1,4-benzoquinol methylase